MGDRRWICASDRYENILGGPRFTPCPDCRPHDWLDEDGNPDGTFDVFDYIALCRDHYQKVGLGADYVERFLR